MKNVLKLIGIIAIIAVIGFSFAACGGDDNGGGNNDPTVTGVSVSPASLSVLKGGTQTFNATVNGTNNPSQSVSWDIVENGKHAQTTISYGTLSVSSSETLATLTIRATSTADTTKSGTATVTIATLDGTWNSSGGRSFIFTGNNYNYKVNDTTMSSGTFSVSGGTIYFNPTGGLQILSSIQFSTGTFTLSGSTSINLTLDGTYTKESGGGGSYTIGDTGPGGGKVFYDKGNDSGGWRYLEVAPVSQGNIRFSSTFANIPGTLNEIGTGKANTALIIAAHPNATAANNAAKACVDYRGPNNKNDWFLPCRNELIELHNNRNVYDDLDNKEYWCSSGVAYNTADYLGFNGASRTQGTGNKGDTHTVRAIRAF